MSILTEAMGPNSYSMKYQFNNGPDISTKFLLQSDEAQDSVRFIDRTVYNTYIEVSGDVVHSTNQVKFLNSSVFFAGGVSNFLKIVDYALEFGENDFTLECIAHPIDNNGKLTIISGSSLLFQISENGALNLYIDNELVAFSEDNIVSLNEWQHLALIRTNNKINLHLDGIIVATCDYNNNLIMEDLLYLGHDPANETKSPFIGYMDEIRLSSTARHSEDFEPNRVEYGGIPEVNLVPTNISLVLLGEDFQDHSSNAYEIVKTGSVQIVNNIFRENAGSFSFDGDPSFINFPVESIDVGSDDFTIEFLFYTPSITLGKTLGIYAGNTGDSDNGNQLYIGVTDIGNVELRLNTDSAGYTEDSNWSETRVAENFYVEESHWYHVCLTRKNNVWCLLLDGKLHIRLFNDGTLVTPTLPGLGGRTLNDEFFIGNIDAFFVRDYGYTSAEFETYYNDITGGSNEDHSITLLVHGDKFEDESTLNNNVSVGAIPPLVVLSQDQHGTAFRFTRETDNYLEVEGDHNIQDNWTIEFRIRRVGNIINDSSALGYASRDSSQTLCSKGWNVDLNANHGCVMRSSSFTITAISKDDIIDELPMNEWVAIAFVGNKSENTIKSFVNGWNIDTITYSDIIRYNGHLRICDGSSDWLSNIQSPAVDFNELRIKSESLYNGNYDSDVPSFLPKERTTIPADYSKKVEEDADIVARYKFNEDKPIALPLVIPPASVNSVVGNSTPVPDLYVMPIIDDDMQGTSINTELWRQTEHCDEGVIVQSEGSMSFLIDNNVTKISRLQVETTHFLYGDFEIECLVNLGTDDTFDTTTFKFGVGGHSINLVRANTTFKLEAFAIKQTILYTQNSAYLKLQRVGDQLSFMYRETDLDSWSTIKTNEVATAGLKASLESYMYNALGSTSVNVEHFKVLSGEVQAPNPLNDEFLEPELNNWELTGSKSSVLTDNTVVTTLSPSTATDEESGIQTILQLNDDFDIEFDIPNIVAEGQNELKVEIVTRDSIFSIIRDINSNVSAGIRVTDMLLDGSDYKVEDWTNNDLTMRVRFKREGVELRAYVWNAQSWEWNGNTNGHLFFKQAVGPTTSISINGTRFGSINAGSLQYTLNHYYILNGTVIDDYVYNEFDDSFTDSLDSGKWLHVMDDALLSQSATTLNVNDTLVLDMEAESTATQYLEFNHDLSGDFDVQISVKPCEGTANYKYIGLDGGSPMFNIAYYKIGNTTKIGTSMNGWHSLYFGGGRIVEGPTVVEGSDVELRLTLVGSVASCYYREDILLPWILLDTINITPERSKVSIAHSIRESSGTSKAFVNDFRLNKGLILPSSVMNSDFQQSSDVNDWNTDYHTDIGGTEAVRNIKDNELNITVDNNTSSLAMISKMLLRGDFDIQIDMDWSAGSIPEDPQIGYTDKDHLLIKNIVSAVQDDFIFKGETITELGDTPLGEMSNNFAMKLTNVLLTDDISDTLICGQTKGDLLIKLNSDSNKLSIGIRGEEVDTTDASGNVVTNTVDEETEVIPIPIEVNTAFNIELYIREVHDWTIVVDGIEYKGDSILPLTSTNSLISNTNLSTDKLEIMRNYVEQEDKVFVDNFLVEKEAGTNNFNRATLTTFDLEDISDVRINGELLQHVDSYIQYGEPVNVYDRGGMGHNITYRRDGSYTMSIAYISTHHGLEASLYHHFYFYRGKPIPIVLDLHSVVFVESIEFTHQEVENNAASRPLIYRDIEYKTSVDNVNWSENKYVRYEWQLQSRQIADSVRYIAIYLNNYTRAWFLTGNIRVRVRDTAQVDVFEYTGDVSNLNVELNSGVRDIEVATWKDQ